LLNEQCVITEKGLRIPIPSKEISSTSLQNSSNPDATFRTKRKENYIGYRASTIKIAEEKQLLFSVSAITGGNIT
jgi:hypothetical protein